MFSIQRGLVSSAVVAGIVLCISAPVHAQDYALRTIVGSLGSGNSQFRFPAGIAIAGDQAIFVADTNLNKVQKFDLGGGFLLSWGGIGEANGKFQSPTDICEGPGGNIYVVDTANNRVQYFSPAGQYIQNFGTGGSNTSAPGKFNTPLGIATDGNDHILVADSLNHRVQILSKSGDPISSFGTFGVNPGEFDQPSALAVNQTTGDIYVVDSGNDRIQCFTKDGQFKFQWGSFGINFGQFANIGGIAIDSHGNAFVADTANLRVQVFGPSGTFLNSIEGPFGQARTFTGPQRVAIDHYGTLYVTDSGGSTSAAQRIMIFDPMGVDNRPPITTIAYSRERADGQWFPGPVTVTLSAADQVGGSGVKHIVYQVDGNAPVTSTDPKVTLNFSTDAHHTLSYHSVDIAGNVEADRLVNIDIDSVVPTLDLQPSPDGRTITMLATDPLSGIDKVTYSLDGGTLLEYSTPLALDGKRHQVVATAIDRAGNKSQTKSVVVNIAPKEIVLPASTPGAIPLTATVRLTDPAPAGGLVVALTSSSPLATIPASITFAAGDVEKTISIATTAVSVATNVTLTATANAQTVTQAFQLVPPSVQSISPTPGTLTGGAPGQVRITLTGPAPKSATAISLGSSSSALVIIAKATVPTGKTYIDVPFKTLPVGGASDTVARVTATTAIGGGAAVSADVTIQRPVIKSITALPSPVAGGKPVTVTVTFTGAIPTVGATIGLSSNSPSLVCPSSVLVKANAQTATFICTTKAVTTRTPAVLTASLNGKDAQTTINVRSIEVLKLSTTPASIVGGTAAKLTVMLTEAAPKGQSVTVALSSDTPKLSVPATVVIPAGKAAAVVDLQTVAVGEVVTASVSASLNGATTKQNVQLLPVEVSKVTLLPAAIKGGSNSQLTVTLATTAVVDTVVTLASSSRTAASVPATCTVPKGSKTAIVTVTTTAVTSNTSVKLTARSGTVTVSGSLNVLK
jgi:hypothetical protein